jgi:integrase
MIYKRGKNGIYSYRFRFAGRMIHESARTKSKTLAREAERQRRRGLEERINNVKKRGLPPTFERASRTWQENRAHRMAAKTQRVSQLALKHLLPVFGPKLLCDITPQDITPQDITDYQRIRLQAGAQGRTVNIEIATLRQVLKAGDSWQPFMGKVKMLHERHDVAKALTPEQERALLESTSKADSACHTATLLALNTAMRKDEIRLLRWGQIDFEKRTLTVGRSKTEAGTGRLIPLNATAYEALAR